MSDALVAQRRMVHVRGAGDLLQLGLVLDVQDAVGVPRTEKVSRDLLRRLRDGPNDGDRVLRRAGLRGGGISWLGEGAGAGAGASPSVACGSVVTGVEKQRLYKTVAQQFT